MRFLNKRVKPFYPSMDMDGSRVGVQLHDSRAPHTISR